ncbi:hypothetical protein [Chachezhania antarctica]|uniref:hypothetical protein n=1 Tax=Chachezhania antarctica TaxID=2340860 RepID=UPI000EB3821D|nr:hypothetical protein [Chachezhania antarctica]|tara:strand:- start:1150 stop:1401 length:252 start_codon:yes stop_codon:yes gene_type:complete
MDRLGPFVLLAGVIGIPGALVIIVLALGYYSPWAIVGAAAVGAVLSIPASHLVARYIKRNDPEWDARREKPKKPAPEERPEVI